MTKHTPGPWAVEADGVNLAICPKTPDDNGFYAIAMMRGPDQDANARLIAAAPDLLAALQLVLHEGPSVSRQERINVARAAIAKATKGSP